LRLPYGEISRLLRTEAVISIPAQRLTAASLSSGFGYRTEVDQCRAAPLRHILYYLMFLLILLLFINFLFYCDVAPFVA